MNFTWIISLLFSFLANAQTNILLEKELWTELAFNKIPSNTVEFKDKKITVAVNSSASPLIYKLKEPQEIKSFEVLLHINGTMNESDKKDDFEEDSYFRMGLVALGDQKMGALGRTFAPKWVVKLFEMAPEGAGLDKIYFYNLGKSKSLIGKQRIHPDTKYMHEHIIEIKNSDEVIFKFELTKPLKIAALWISIDGDQTKSKFETEIKKIILK